MGCIRMCGVWDERSTRACYPPRAPRQHQRREANLPELWVTTPRLLTSSIPLSSTSLRTAWNAPLTLNAPIFWKFSALKNSLMFGLAGSCPSHGVPFNAAGDCGVDARFESVVLVSTGVVWMYGLIRACAARTDSRVRGSSIDDMVPV